MPAGPADLPIQQVQLPGSATPVQASVHPWLAGGAVATMTAQLTLGQIGNGQLVQNQAVAWLGRTVGPWSLRVVGGGTWGGRVSDGAGTHDLGPGWIVGATMGRNYLPQQGLRPYVSGSAAFAVASAGNSNVRLTAVDMRVGVQVGWTLWQRLDLTGVGRLFGGPVFYRRGDQDVTGSDRRHFQLGVGAIARVHTRFAVFAEYIPLGEAGASVGAAMRW